MFGFQTIQGRGFAASESHTRRSGFTLVELLITVAIMALLVAILLPALARSRDLAKQASCAANLHGLGTAMTMYLTDHNYFPGCNGMAADGNVVAVWPVRLRVYLNNNLKVFNCPARDPAIYWETTTPATGATQDIAGATDTGWSYFAGEQMLPVVPNGKPFSYGYNNWGSVGHPTNPQRGLGGDLWSVVEVRASLVQAPSQMIAIADRVDGQGWPWEYDLDPTTTLEYPGNVHHDGANVLYVDGHADWRLQADMINLGNNQVSSEWNNDNAP